MKKLKIDVVVPGRFHAFHLARALLTQGHDVIVFTNYPKSICQRFGLPPNQVRSLLLHGVAVRLISRLAYIASPPRLATLERQANTWFGRWASQHIREDADLVYVFSGVGEEILRLPRSRNSGLRFLVRGSSHIREQYRLLTEEEQRLGREIDKPTAWRIRREEREYELADKIIVLSSFAEQSFVDHGVPRHRLILNAAGVDTTRFRASPDVIEQRCRRIKAGGPLQILTVGSFSARKGALDLAAIARSLARQMGFRVVADCGPEVAGLAQQCSELIEFHQRVPEFELVKEYESADVFLFPTIEDGYAAVLAQALAAGLPVLTTRNCSAPDLVTEGRTGWLLPIRSPERFIERLSWCDAHRKELAMMVRNAHADFKLRDWSEVATGLVKACEAVA